MPNPATFGTVVVAERFYVDYVGRVRIPESFLDRVGETFRFRVAAEDLGVNVHHVRRKVKQLSEVNPMLGHRGCRLLISHPEIADMQARAITEAACLVAAEGLEVKPEITLETYRNASDGRRYVRFPFSINGFTP